MARASARRPASRCRHRAALVLRHRRGREHRSEGRRRREVPRRRCHDRGDGRIDRLVGTRRADVIVPRGGNDVVRARGGNDKTRDSGGRDRSISVQARTRPAAGAGPTSSWAGWERPARRWARQRPDQRRRGQGPHRRRSWRRHTAWRGRERQHRRRARYRRLPRGPGRNTIRTCEIGTLYPPDLPPVAMADSRTVAEDDAAQMIDVRQRHGPRRRRAEEHRVGDAAAERHRRDRGRRQRAHLQAELQLLQLARPRLHGRLRLGHRSRRAARAHRSPSRSRA